MLVLGVLPGVLLGVVLSLARLLIEVARPRDAVLRRLPTDRRFHDLADDEGGETTPGVLVYRLYAPLIFANARYVTDRLRALVAAANPPVRCLVIDLQAVTHVDVTALQALRDLHDELEVAGMDVRFARANRPLREQLTAVVGGPSARQRTVFPVGVGRRRRLPRHAPVADRVNRVTPLRASRSPAPATSRRHRGN